MVYSQLGASASAVGSYPRARVGQTHPKTPNHDVLPTRDKYADEIRLFPSSALDFVLLEDWRGLDLRSDKWCASVRFNESVWKISVGYADFVSPEVENPTFIA